MEDRRSRETESAVWAEKSQQSLMALMKKRIWLMAKGKPSDSVNGWQMAREIAGWLHGADQACALQQIDRAERRFREQADAKPTRRRRKKTAKKESVK